MINKTKQNRFGGIEILITLLSLEVMAYFYFGIRTVIMMVLCMGSAVISDFICVKSMKRDYEIDGLMALCDGAVIALMMPASIEFEIPILSTIFAIVIGENLFGGNRNMIFSPPAIGYLFALTSWGTKLLLYPDMEKKLNLFENNDTFSHSLSYIFNNTGKISVSNFDILIGNFQGPMGAVSILLLIVSALVLILRKRVSIGAFIGALIGLVMMAYISPIIDSRVESVGYMLSTNMFLFALIYIVSDKRIAPEKPYYSMFYGLLISFFSYILILTSGKENVIITVTVLMTPLSLFFKTLEKKINSYAEIEKEARSLKETAENIVDDEAIETTDEDLLESIAEDALIEIDKISNYFTPFDDDNDYDEIYDAVLEKGAEIDE